MASFNGPKLTNPIRTDVPDTQDVLVALAKQDPTPISDIPVGAKRLYEASSGKWQWQEYNGSSWAAVPFIQHNVDQLDGFHAAITPAANTVAVRNASGLLQDSITGNAATASSAATLSQTLPVNKGGTGATTSEAARENLGVPPTSHASTNTTHGVGNATQYGHLKLSDAANSSSGVSGGVAATPAAVKAAKDAADAAQSSADAAMIKASTLATSSTPGIVKPGTGMTVDAAGSLNVTLNNTVTSTSTTQAATANAVKTAYDKAKEASDDVTNVMSAVDQVQADVSGKLDNTTVHLVDTWKSTNGTSWYRKWSDGWIEQGGFVKSPINAYDDGSAAPNVVNFFVPFKNTNYTLITTAQYPDINWGNPAVKPYYRQVYAWGSTTNKTSKTNFTISNMCDHMWYACGY